MPHVTVQYTANIAGDADIPGLLERMNAVLIAQNGVFPVKAVRSRAIELTHYRVGDGRNDYAFLHVTVAIMPGRPKELVDSVRKQLFAAVMDHLAPLTARRHLGVTLEIQEMNAAQVERFNNYDVVL